jgi:hypothetical protein
MKGMASADHESLPRAAMRTVGSSLSRTLRAFLSLEREQRMAAIGALALLASMFLPWYSKNFTVAVEHSSRIASASSHLTAFQAFSWVEAGVLLVSAGVLFLLFKRAEGSDFRVPGNDGTVITGAGAWAVLLVFYRFFDKRQGNPSLDVTMGVTWGIFFALLAAGFLAYSGTRLRHLLIAATPACEAETAPAAEARTALYDGQDDGYDEAYGEQPAQVPPPPPPRRRRRPAPWAEPVQWERGELESVELELDPDPEPAPPAPRTRYPPRPPAAGPGPVTPAGRTSSPRQRWVTREDAEQLSFDDPPTEPQGDRERRRRR